MAGQTFPAFAVMPLLADLRHDKTPIAMQNHAEPSDESATGHGTIPGRSDSVWSLAAFWCVAFIGASLFAAVLIAPRWQERETLRARVRYQLVQCEYLADVNDHYSRVIEAFKHDPDFKAEVARFALGYVAPNEERLTAPIQNWTRPKPPYVEPESPDTLEPFIRLFAQDVAVRHTALISAAVFIVVSVAFFNKNSTPESSER